MSDTGLVKNECLIIVPDDKHDLYFERLCFHFANGNMDVVSSNRQMQYESYRMKIIALWKNNKQVREVCFSSAQGNRYPLFTNIKEFVMNDTVTGTSFLCIRLC
jgi:hypothetical protein